MTLYKLSNHQRARGFILTEVMIVIPIIVTICLFLAYLVTYQYWVFNTESAELTISSDARYSLDTIGTYVRGATRVLSSYDTYETGPQTLVLQLSALDAEGVIIAGVYDTVVFSLSNTDLMMNLFPGSGSSRETLDRKIASDVDVVNFNFTYDDADYDAVTMVTTTMALNSEVRTQIGSPSRSITLSSQSKLRAHND